MLTNFHRLCKASAVAALTFGVAFAQPAQKADAQSIPAIKGGGTDTVTDLLSSVNGPVKDYVQDPANSPTGAAPAFDYSKSYVVTGSGFGRTAFLNVPTFFNGSPNPNYNASLPTFDFVATDSLGSSFGAGAKVLNNIIVDSTNRPVIDPSTNLHYLVVNQAFVRPVFVYNVKFSNGNNFNVSINGNTACRIVRGNTSLGDPVNWNQVTNSSGQVGPNLPIKRVGYGDVNGQTAIHQGVPGENDIFTDSTLTRRGTYGLIPVCNGKSSGGVPTRHYPGGPVLDAAPGFTGSGAIPSIIGPGINGFNDGTALPNVRTGATGDIIVNAASPTGNAPADPIAAAAAFGNDNDNTPQLVGPNNPGNFRGSYARGVINAVRSNNGAIGYVADAIANRAIALLLCISSSTTN